MTHAELLARASSAELAEWQAYLRLEDRERKAREQRAAMESGARAGVETRKRRMRSR